MYKSRLSTHKFLYTFYICMLTTFIAPMSLKQFERKRKNWNACCHLHQFCIGQRSVMHGFKAQNCSVNESVKEMKWRANSVKSIKLLKQIKVVESNCEQFSCEVEVSVAFGRIERGKEMSKRTNKQTKERTNEMFQFPFINKWLFIVCDELQFQTTAFYWTICALLNWIILCLNFNDIALFVYIFFAITCLPNFLFAYPFPFSFYLFRIYFVSCPDSIVKPETEQLTWLYAI